MPPLLGILLLSAIVSFAQRAPRSLDRSPDLVVLDANIHTLVSADTRAQALAVTGNRILAVGTNPEIRKLIGPNTKVIDAHGNLLLPGFNDAHVHFSGIGNSFSTLDLKGLRTTTEIEQRIKRYTSFLPAGRWILGGGWTDALPPTRASIENLSPDNPVFLYHVDAQGAFANAAAFKLARLSNVAGIEKDSEGNATGVVRGDAMKRIASVVPADHTRNWLEVAQAATNYAASLGVTSVQDMHSDDLRPVYLELERQGKLKTRVYDCILLKEWKKLADSSRESSGAMVRAGCLKGFSDGDSESSSDLLPNVIAADKAGLQVMIHAIGNSANDIVLGVYEQVTKQNGQRDRRYRVEHAHNPRREDLPRFSSSNIIASMQPYLFESSNGRYIRSMFRLNTAVAFGSDAAITDFDPLLGIHAAVNAGSESISIYEAVRAYTVGSAYAEFQEREKGTIEPGKLADFVILSDDIFKTEPGRIREAKVLTTVVDGRIVYQSK